MNAKSGRFAVVRSIAAAGGLIVTMAVAALPASASPYVDRSAISAASVAASPAGASADDMVLTPFLRHVKSAAPASSAGAARLAAVRMMKEMGLRPEQRAFELQNLDAGAVRTLPAYSFASGFGPGGITSTHLERLATRQK